MANMWLSGPGSNNQYKYILAANNLIYGADNLVTNVTLYKKYDSATGNGGVTWSDAQSQADNCVAGTERRENGVVYFGIDYPARTHGYAYTSDVAVAWYDYKDFFTSGNTISIIKRDTNDRALVIVDKNVMTGVCVWERPADAPTGDVTPVTYTLTLKGNLIDRMNPTVVEYIQDGKRYEAEGLSYGRDAVTGGPAYMEYKIPVVNTGVVIYDADVVSSYAGYMAYDASIAAGRPSAQDIYIVATPRAGGVGSATVNFVLAGNLTLDNIPTVAEKVFTLHFAPSIQVDANTFKGWSDDTGWTAITPVKSNTAGEYSFKVGQAVGQVDLKTSAAKHVFIVSDPSSTTSPVNAVRHGGATDFTTKSTFTFDNQVKDMWIYEAVWVDVDATAAGIKYGSMELHNSTNDKTHTSFWSLRIPPLTNSLPLQPAPLASTLLILPTPPL